MEDIKELVKATLGPRPNVCQEQVLLDLERARMAKEDTLAAEKAKQKALRRIEQVIQDVRGATWVQGRNEQQTIALSRASMQLQWATEEMQGINPFWPLPWTQRVAGDGDAGQGDESESTEEEADSEPS